MDGIHNIMVQNKGGEEYTSRSSGSVLERHAHKPDESSSCTAETDSVHDDPAQSISCAESALSSFNNDTLSSVSGDASSESSTLCTAISCERGDAHMMKGNKSVAACHRLYKEATTHHAKRERLREDALRAEDEEMRRGQARLVSSSSRRIVSLKQQAQQILAAKVTLETDTVDSDAPPAGTTRR